MNYNKETNLGNYLIYIYVNVYKYSDFYVH